MIAIVGCGSAAPGGGTTDWPKLETAVASICACADRACVDRESAGWDDLPWPDLRGASRATWDRSVALELRGNRCQLGMRAKPELDQFAQWAVRMCACPDAACASAVDDEAVAWFRQMEHEPVGSRIVLLAHDSIVALDACHAKLAGGTATAPAPLPDAVPARIAATAERICTCSTMACADLFAHELLDWIDMQHKTLHDPPLGMVLSREAKAGYATFEKCHTEKSVKWPHKSSLHARTGIDP